MTTRLRRGLAFVVVALVALPSGAAASGPKSQPARATVRASVGSGGSEAKALAPATFAGPAVSSDGRYVAFTSSASNLVPGDTNGADDVFVTDRQTDSTSRMSLNTDGLQADAASGEASFSADGRYVAFSSDATNLVSGDDNKSNDIFVHDRQTGATIRVSVGTGGPQGDRASYEPTNQRQRRSGGFHV